MSSTWVRPVACIEECTVESYQTHLTVLSPFQAEARERCPTSGPARQNLLPGCEMVSPGYRQTAAKASHTSAGTLVGPHLESILQTPGSGCHASRSLRRCMRAQSCTQTAATVSVAELASADRDLASGGPSAAEGPQYACWTAWHHRVKSGVALHCEEAWSALMSPQHSSLWQHIQAAVDCAGKGSL